MSSSTSKRLCAARAPNCNTPGANYAAAAVADRTAATSSDRDWSDAWSIVLNHVMLEAKGKFLAAARSDSSVMRFLLPTLNVHFFNQVGHEREEDFVKRMLRSSPARRSQGMPDPLTITHDESPLNNHVKDVELWECLERDATDMQIGSLSDPLCEYIACTLQPGQPFYRHVSGPSSETSVQRGRRVSTELEHAAFVASGTADVVDTLCLVDKIHLVFSQMDLVDDALLEGDEVFAVTRAFLRHIVTPRVCSERLTTAPDEHVFTRHRLDIGLASKPRILSRRQRKTTSDRVSGCYSSMAQVSGCYSSMVLPSTPLWLRSMVQNSMLPLSRCSEMPEWDQKHALVVAVEAHKRSSYDRVFAQARLPFSIDAVIASNSRYFIKPCFKDTVYRFITVDTLVHHVISDVLRLLHGVIALQPTSELQTDLTLLGSDIFADHVRKSSTTSAEFTQRLEICNLLGVLKYTRRVGTPYRCAAARVAGISMMPFTPDCVKCETVLCYDALASNFVDVESLEREWPGCATSNVHLRHTPPLALLWTRVLGTFLHKWSQQKSPISHLLVTDEATQREIQLRRGMDEANDFDFLWCKVPHLVAHVSAVHHFFNGDPDEPDPIRYKCDACGEMHVVGWTTFNIHHRPQTSAVRRQWTAESQFECTRGRKTSQLAVRCALRSQRVFDSFAWVESGLHMAHSDLESLYWAVVGMPLHNLDGALFGTVMRNCAGIGIHSCFDFIDESNPDCFGPIPTLLCKNVCTLVEQRMLDFKKWTQIAKVRSEDGYRPLFAHASHVENRLCEGTCVATWQADMRRLYEPVLRSQLTTTRSCVETEIAAAIRRNQLLTTEVRDLKQRDHSECAKRALCATIAHMVRAVNFDLLALCSMRFLHNNLHTRCLYARDWRENVPKRLRQESGQLSALYQSVARSVDTETELAASILCEDPFSLDTRVTDVYQRLHVEMKAVARNYKRCSSDRHVE